MYRCYQYIDIEGLIKWLLISNKEIMKIKQHVIISTEIDVQIPIILDEAVKPLNDDVVLSTKVFDAGFLNKLNSLGSTFLLPGWPGNGNNPESIMFTNLITD